jgi:uncharacterized protein (TIGR03435 family)
MVKYVVKPLLCMLAASVFAQTPGVRPSFEVASVKPNNSNSGNSTTNSNLGRLTARNVTVKSLLMQAYRVQAFQVIGGPGWVETERFDIDAKAEEGAVPPSKAPFDPSQIDPTSLMVQSLLEDRFQLKLHRETREQPVYTLSIGKDGPKFKAVDPEQSGPPPAPVAGVGPGRVPPPSAMGVGNMGTSVSNGAGAMSAHAVPMARFIAFLSSQLGRPVIDNTNMQGVFDFHVEWTRDTNVSISPTAPSGAAPLPPPPDAPSGPSMFTAVQEQLGLKLDSGKGPVEVIVIDSVQKPSDN